MDGAAFLLVVILIRSVLGGICAAIASSKGRSAVGWFFIGLLIDIIGIIVICCLSNLTEDRAFKEHALREQHRLREQLAQERLKAEAFRSHTYDRLDAHDHVLGIDTRATNLLGQATGPMLLESSDPANALAAMAGQDASAPAGGASDGPGGVAPRASREERVWYYECSGQAVGPITATDLRRLVQNRQIAPSTLVWCQTMTDWAPLAQVATLRAGEAS